MAKGAWIGVGGKARKIKNMYIGIGGKARKIKKAWIGVGGKARLFFSSGGEIAKYTGTIENLKPYGKSGHAGGSVGGYAIFIGGDATGNTGTKYIDIYSSSLVYTQRSGKYKMLDGCNSATIGNLAIFNGGESPGSGGMGMTRGYTFNNSLTMTELTNFYKGNATCGAASNGTYAFFAGGYYITRPEDEYEYNETNHVYYFNSSGTVAAASSKLPKTCDGLGGGRVGNYVVFGGGYSYYSHIANVTAYNTSATRTLCSDLSLKRRWMGTGTAGVNKYVIFAGGSGHPTGAGIETGISNIDIYNESLTRSTATLSSARCDHTGGTAGELAVFAGGGSSSTSGSTTSVICFDESLTVKSTTDLSSIMRNGACAVAGEYFLIAGGTNHKKIVDAYKFS